MSEEKTILDHAEMQLKVGLEVHQQLATSTKLFCACPPFVGDESKEISDKTTSFRRILRPAASELGEIDEAAEFESRHIIRVKYIASKTASCLVEADEEPPHPISKEALETALLFSLALKSRIADEIHVMRKIVVDGYDAKVAVQTIGLEEDAGRAVRDDNQHNGERTYALDRLGTPLVEVALAPIQGSPQDVESAARTLGRLMRATGRVARGLGTIRQDLNISVMNGKVIEVKGVQRLDQIRKVVLFEASRQKFFFDLAKEIRERIGGMLEIQSQEVTSLFLNSNSNVIKKALSTGESCVVCLTIKGFAGFIGRENGFHSRLGKELGAIAKTYGLGGVFHSDELPNYGITHEEVSLLRSKHGITIDDAFVLIAGSRQSTTKAADALKKRLQHATIGVPAETRAASLEGETTFLRPRPGAARMYPETDIPLIQVSPDTLTMLRAKIPEPWEKQVNSFSNKYDLPPQLGEPLFDSERKDLFERVIENTKLPPRYVASFLVDSFLALSRNGVRVDLIADEILLGLFEALSAGKFAKEALSEILKQISLDQNLTLEEALAKAGLGLIKDDELVKIVDEIIEQNIELAMAKGPSAHSILMGKVMQKVRGKVDGRLVNETLTKRLAAALKGKS
ncbi:MAG: Glu-tRNA(Gln) amidotransferase subunit GatE [Nitrososphaerales archaeon]